MASLHRFRQDLCAPSVAWLVVAVVVAHCTACTHDLDCSLNGVCTGGACVCDMPWTSRDCGVIRRAEADPGGIYGYSPNVSAKPDARRKAARCIPLAGAPGLPAPTRDAGAGLRVA